MYNLIRKESVRKIMIMVLLIVMISLTIIQSQQEKPINTNAKSVSTKK